MLVIFLKTAATETTQKHDLLKHPICITDFDHDYILKEVDHRERLELEINLRDDGDEEIILLIISYLFIS